MKSIRTRAIALAATFVALSSCASMQRAADQGSASRVASLLAEGKSKELAAMSASPFLLDGEIIALPDDVATFWQGAAAAGLRLEPELARAVSVGPETWKEFGSSREVRTYFAKYVAAGARLFELSTPTGGRVLLLVREAWFSRRIYGFRGPF